MSIKDLSSYEFKQSFQHELYGEIVELSHKKSGASLTLIKNKDEARFFSATFRTPPYDDTGIFHVFEHSVLAGSRLHPSKSNFFHVYSSSIASFINAQTWPVFTTYPYVTKSDKEFHNLLSVYMDAVFFPKTTSDPRIVKREGWRYEVDKDDRLKFNGIVFSEMKGSLSDPKRLVYSYLTELLLPSTPYKYESGGKPENVVDLKFEQIVEAHREFYHPQNALINLYGDLDFEKTLKVIDEKFLSHFEKDSNFKPKEIPLQKSLTKKVIKKSYPSSQTEKSDYIASGYVLGEKSLVDSHAIRVLLFAFTDETSSSLKLNTLKQGLAKDVALASCMGEDNAFAVVFEGSEEKNLEKIKSLLKEEILKASKEGLDSKLLESVLNSWEFDSKEKKNQSHKGLELSLEIIRTWLYPQNSLKECLDHKKLFKKIRENLENKEYVKNFFKSLLENDTNCFLVMKPDPDYSKKFNQILEDKLSLALKEKNIQEFKEEDNQFKEWNTAEESKEIIGKSPVLDLKGLQDLEKALPFKKSKTDQYELIEYPQKTHDISYIKLFFDLKGVKKEDIKNLRLLESLLQKTDSKNYPFKELSQEIDTHFGSLSFHSDTYQSFKNPKEFKALLEVSFSFLNENKEKVFSLLRELLTDRSFTPLSQVEACWNEKKVAFSHSISDLAPSFASNSVKKHFYKDLASFQDELYGSSQVNYILKEDIKKEDLSLRMKEIFKSLFNKNQLKLVTLTTDEKQMEVLKSEIEALTKTLPSKDSKKEAWDFSDKHYEAFLIPGEVQYNYAGILFEDLPYHGSRRVYTQYLFGRYLYPKLREQGGAYGAGSQALSSGLFILGTYRDPNLKSSFEAFKDIPSFMKEEDLSEENLKPAILGALKPYYEDTSVAGKTSFLTDLYLTEKTWEDHIRFKKEILNTKKEDINKITTSLEKALPSAKRSVSGSKKKLEKEAPYLKEVLKLP